MSSVAMFGANPATLGGRCDRRGCRGRRMSSASPKPNRPFAGSPRWQRTRSPGLGPRRFLCSEPSGFRSRRHPGGVDEPRNHPLEDRRVGLPIGVEHEQELTATDASRVIEGHRLAFVDWLVEEANQTRLDEFGHRARVPSIDASSITMMSSAGHRMARAPVHRRRHHQLLVVCRNENGDHRIPIMSTRSLATPAPVCTNVIGVCEGRRQLPQCSLLPS